MLQWQLDYSKIMYLNIYLYIQFSQALLVLPMFLMPVHYLVAIGCSYYLYYFGLIGHSGNEDNRFFP